MNNENQRKKFQRTVFALCMNFVKEYEMEGVLRGANNINLEAVS